MNFKSFDNFTLKECEEYLRLNPHGLEVSAVMDRIRALNEQKKYRLTFDVKGVYFDMIAVAGGTFQMGEEYEWYQFWKANKRHTVTLDDYYIGETPVTQELWQAVMDNNPSFFLGNNNQCPVERVSWFDCQAFVSELNIMLEEQLPSGRKFRLPTEAEWEFAAIGGSKDKGCEFSGSHSIEKVAWYDGNSESTTHPVGKKSPNELGLYDMSGNVWEWCSDSFVLYPSKHQTNPRVNQRWGSGRVLRGGSWYNNAQCCHVAFRNFNNPSCRNNYYGLRLAF